MKSVVFIINKLIKIKVQARYHKYIGKKGVLYKVMVVRNIVIFSLLIDDSEILTMKTESVGSRSNAGTSLIYSVSLPVAGNSLRNHLSTGFGKVSGIALQLDKTE